MFSVHEDGKVDVYIFRDPKNPPSFHASNSCNDYVRENVLSILEEFQENYGARPLQQILCVPHNDLERFITENDLS